MHSTPKNQKSTNICLLPPLNQNTPVSISSISPQSSSDLDTDHDDMIDETIRHLTKTLNQTLQTLNISNSNKNKAPNDPPWIIHQPYNQDKTKNHKPYLHQQIQNKKNTDKTHSLRDAITPPAITFELTKQMIMDIDRLSHSTTLHNIIVQSLNLKCLCKYNNLHKAYF